MTPETIQRIKSHAFWYKFAAIISYIGGGVMILIGIPFLLILVGAFYIAFGVLTIYFGTMIWKAGVAAATIDQTNSTENTTTIALSVGDLVRINGIITIVSLVLSIFAGIAFGAFFATAFNDGRFGDFKNQFYSGSSTSISSTRY